MKLPNRELLKVYGNEDFYNTSRPDFIEIGSVNDFGSSALLGFQLISQFADYYDWKNSKEVTLEETFRECIRVQPAIPEIFGEIAADRFAPCSNTTFNMDQNLIDGCRYLIDAVCSAFSNNYNARWICTSTQMPAIAPGSYINTHVDGYLSYLWSEKIHVPIITNDSSYNVGFSNDGKHLTYTHLEVGKIYIINNLKPHSAFNFGDTYRAHFIMDLFDLQKRTQLVKEHPEQSLYLTQVPGLDEKNAIFAETIKNLDLPATYKRFIDAL